MKLFVALLVVLVVAVQCAPQERPKVRRNMVRGRPVGGLVKKPKEYPRDRSAKQGFFDNRIDHFDPTNTDTFSQRYWYNDQWYKSGGPVFFMLGGESEEDPFWVESTNLEWTTLAKQLNAFVFLAEHRFYGESRPTSDMSTSNLVYLSSAQALEDYATFITGMKQKFPQLASAKWVSFGGSYSGALAAWLRLKHPELISIAVGSSGPVQAEADFTEYLEVVQNSITMTSQSCAASVAQGMAQVAQLMATASGRQTLKSTFDLCATIDPTNDKQVKYFWETVYSPYMEIVQYSGDNAGVFHNSLTIEHAICRFHNDNTINVLSRMQKVNQYFNEEFGYFGCNDIDYNGFISFMKDTTYGNAQDDRAWIWQTCTEFGYYQSTDSTTAGPFFGGSPNLPVQYYIDECTAIYGSQYNSVSVAAAVNKTNAYYGGRNNLQSSYILLPNGSFDPWHALGKLNSTQSTVIPVVISGTSHCADMYGSSVADPASLTAARQQVTQQVTTWLSQMN